MTKREFTEELKLLLDGLPKKEVEERIVFYSEMIDDRMEDGATEEEAVALIGSVEDVAAQIAAGFTVINGEKSRVPSKRKLGAGEIAILAIGSPVWLSLLIAAFAVGISLYVSMWAVVISVWACFITCAVCVPAGVVIAVIGFTKGNVASGFAILGAAIFSAGLTILFLYASKALTKVSLTLTRKSILLIKVTPLLKNKGNKGAI